MHIRKTDYYVYIDGGICSQIFQYMIGYALSEKGYKVKYDTSWFFWDGKDLNGKRNRRLTLKKLSPHLKFPRIGIVYSKYCRKHYFNKENYGELKEWPVPAYYGGYYSLDLCYYPLFSRVIAANPKMDSANRKMFNTIINDKRAVAVHVRRGDMSTQIPTGYWTPTSIDYYIKAFEQFKDCSFYFFTDEKKWVLDSLVGHLSNYTVVDINSPSKGYLDLFLLMQFDKIICSTGSLGVYGLILGTHDSKEAVIMAGSQAKGALLSLGNVKITEISQEGIVIS